VFVGPPAGAITAMGLKDRAKALMQKAGVAVVPGYLGEDQAPKHLASEAAKIGYPVLIKAVAGGGGKGMRRVDAPAEFDAALESAKRESKSSFGDDRVLIEKYVTRPRHIEMQVFADSHGNAVHLFERDCSLQRRHQKVIEEATAPGMPEAMRKAMGEAAVKAAKAVGYVGAGTIEFIADASEGLKADRFWFMEMNTRLQVEHPVTELVTGHDLVHLQFRIAAGEKLPFQQEDIELRGHAIECRIYAEDPDNNYFPSPGTITLALEPGGPGIRCDSGMYEGWTVPLDYDPLLAKLIGYGATRDEAIARLRRALDEYFIGGIKTNIGLFRRILDNSDFKAGKLDTGFLDRLLAAGKTSVNHEQDKESKIAAIAAGLFTALDAVQGNGTVTNGAKPSNAPSKWRLAGRAEAMRAVNVKDLG
jgi:3-methylcrotonyl-CoA carboxylase alpha subunit